MIDNNFLSRDVVRRVENLFKANKNRNSNPTKDRKQKELISLSKRLYDHIPAICWMSETTLAESLGVSLRQIKYAKYYLLSNGKIRIDPALNGKRSNPIHKLIKISPEYLNTSTKRESKKHKNNIVWDLFNDLSADDLNYSSIKDRLNFYEKMNIPFIPLHYPKFDEKNRPYCSCSKKQLCNSIGKHPIVRYKELDFSIKQTYKEMKHYWLERDANFNIGFITNDFLVIDVDYRNGGNYSLERLQETYGELSKELTVKTGNGIHFYLNGNEFVKNNTNILGFQGIDIKAKGGIVIAPFSKHHSDNFYEWLSISPPESLPADLLNDIQKETLEISKGAKLISKSGLPKYFDSDFVISKGKRNDTLFRVASRERGRGKKMYEILTSIEETNSLCCKPKLPQEDLFRIAKSASRYKTNLEKELALAP